MITCFSKGIWTLVVLSACALVATPGMAQLRSQPVVVTNGTTQPVPTAAQGITPVSGTVSVSNTPSVTVANTPNVYVSNMPNVNVANTPSVNVANTPNVSLAQGSSVAVTNLLNGQNNPIPLASLEATQPYEDQCAISFLGRFDNGCLFRRIPAGKRLVIQQFDAAGALETGLKPVSIVVDTGSFHFFTASFMGTSLIFSPPDNFATHQETRLYVESNSEPNCQVTLSNNSNDGSYHCGLSGFLVDVP